MKKNNHYVPQTYLKQWATNKSIYEYRLLVPHKRYPQWKKVSISKTSSVNALYLYIYEGKMTDEMEDFFSTEFEMQYNDFISKVNSYAIWDEKDKEYVSKLIISQYIRTLAGYKRIKKTIINNFDEMIENLSTSIQNECNQASTLKLHNQSEIEYNKFIPLKIDFSEKINDVVGVNINSIVGKSSWLFALKYHLNSTYKVLESVSWCVYDAPNNFSWVTSDDPVILLNYFDNNNYNFNGGLKVNNVNIIFPLTPKKLLFATIGKQTILYQKADYVFAEKIQKFIVENAYSKVYSNHTLKKIKKLRKREVDEIKFNTFNKSLQNFHNNYIQNELPLLNR